MIQKDIITNLVISKLTDTRYFLVDVTVSADNVIKVEIDAEDGVDIDFCVELNRFIEANFDREVEDYELEVGSAGLTSATAVTPACMRTSPTRMAMSRPVPVP